MAVPVNLRSDADPAGGNRFAGVNLAAPIGIVDPAKRIQKIRAQMTRKRDERAIDMVGAIAPVLSLLPDAVLESMAGSVVGSDVQASNVPVYPGDTFIAGAKVLRQYGHWPAARCGDDGGAGVARRLGAPSPPATTGRRSPTTTLFARCLLDGFDEVLALGGDGRAVPASFTVGRRRIHSTVAERKCAAMTLRQTRRAKPRTMRLPGSVAEIKASPAGPKIGAFFDLDGTLVAGFTGVIMTQERLRRRQMGVGEFIGMVQAGLNHQLGRSEFEDLIGKGARMLRGSSLERPRRTRRATVRPDRSEAGSIPRCASWCAPTWPAATPSCSARRR